MILDEKVFRKMGAEFKIVERNFESPNTGEMENAWAWSLNGVEFDTAYRHYRTADDVPEDTVWDTSFTGCDDELPPISSSWEVCAKYLVPFMREKGWEFICEGKYTDNKDYRQAGWENTYIAGVAIKDDNLALAACEAFMEVKL